MKTPGNSYTYSLNNFNLMTSLLSILNSNSEDDTYFVLAKYFLQHFEHLEHLSIYDAAEECYVSRSSIQRFAKFIGFDSFTAMKQNSQETKRHFGAFFDYANRPEFNEYLNTSMNEMMDDISEMTRIQNLFQLAELIHDNVNVVILIADIASSPARVFQQGMLAMGKLVRIVTDSNVNLDLLGKLCSKDLLITVSITGNYAFAINQELSTVRSNKILITLNHTRLFENYYTSIFYLSRKFHSCDHISSGRQNVYTRYGAGYFFDLLFNLYVHQYLCTENQSELP